MFTNIVYKRRELDIVAEGDWIRQGILLQSQGLMNGAVAVFEVSVWIEAPSSDKEIAIRAEVGEKKLKLIFWTGGVQRIVGIHSEDKIVPVQKVHYALNNLAYSHS